LRDPAVIADKARQMSPLVSITRAAMILRVEVLTVRRQQKAGKVPPQHKRSRRMEYDRRAIEAMAGARSGAVKP
jgi:predicted site-specific integrase-resolvase